MINIQISSDEFLSNIVKILKLGNEYRFTIENRTKLDINKDQEKKIKKLCEDNKYRRNIFNHLFSGSGDVCNENWSYDVMRLYFQLDFDENKNKK